MDMEGSINKAKEQFAQAVAHLKSEFSKLQIGRAHTGLVESIMVDMYGTMQPLKALANVAVPEPKTLMIQPWDRGALHAIEKAITESGLGLNPVNNGVAVIINMPPMTEERRAEVAKIVKSLAEEAKIAVRTARQDAHNAFKQMKEAGDMTEDDVFGAEKRLQTTVDEANSQIEALAASKEKDIMTI